MRKTNEDVTAREPGLIGSLLSQRQEHVLRASDDGTNQNKDLSMWFYGTTTNSGSFCEILRRAFGFSGLEGAGVLQAAWARLS
jgi:hypothetical protein